MKTTLFGSTTRTDDVFALFGSHRVLTTKGNKPVDLAAGDFDNDGYLDLASAEAGMIAWYKNEDNPIKHKNIVTTNVSQSCVGI